ncbi:MAG: HAD family phosphatase [Candidatus Promineifilaceae bacterium]
MNRFFPHPIKAILFDLDGTLIDTDDAAVLHLAQRLRPLARQHAPRLARAITMKVETPGNALITLFDILHLDQPLFHLKERWRATASGFRLIAGIPQMINELDDAYRIGLVTTRSRHDVHAFLEQFPAIAARVEVTCSAQDTRRLKPHPQPVQFAAARLGLAPAHCLMVGDTTVDIHSARRAGAWSVGVLCGFGERPELEKAGAHVILDSTAQLGMILSNS